MSKLQKEYERTIKKYMNIIVETAKTFNIPMFSTFQVSPDEFKTFCVNEDYSNRNKIKLMYFIDQTWSLDEFIEMVLDDAQKNGHDSTFLLSLGMPKSPENEGIKKEQIKLIKEQLIARKT
jgi:hypothetical protein